MAINVKDIWRFEIRSGNSKHPRDGACVLDAVSWLTYGTLGDYPPCVCPVIAAFVRPMNDCLPNRRRQRLRTYIPRLMRSNDPRARDERRALLINDLYRVYLPAFLRSIDESDFADRYRDVADDHLLELNFELYQAIKTRESATPARSAATILRELLSYPPLRLNLLAPARAYQDWGPLYSNSTEMIAAYITDWFAPEINSLYATLDALLAIGNPSMDEFTSNEAAMSQFELERTI